MLIDSESVECGDMTDSLHSILSIQIFLLFQLMTGVVCTFQITVFLCALLEFCLFVVTILSVCFVYIAWFKVFLEEIYCSGSFLSRKLFLCASRWFWEIAHETRDCFKTFYSFRRFDFLFFAYRHFEQISIEKPPRNFSIFHFNTLHYLQSYVQ